LKKETILENAILKYLSLATKWLFWKNPDQQECRNGVYRKHPWSITGISDIICCLPNGKTLWVEVKTDTGRQSPAQKQFEKSLTDLGHSYFVVRSLKDIENIVKDYQNV